MKIQILKKTSNKSFSYLAGINRPINPAQVTKLAESVKKLGVLRPIIVSVISFLNGKPTTYIIDGQHLFNAFIRLNIDIEYVSIDIKNKKELVESIALLNASSKNWAMIDYITAWSSVEDDYKKLLHYYNVYDLELSHLSAILSGRSIETSISKTLKRGEFKIVGEHAAVKVMDYLTDILTIVPRLNRFENKYLCGEYVKFLRANFNDYNHTEFITKLKKNKEKFILATHEPEKLSEMFRKLSN